MRVPTSWLVVLGLSIAGCGEILEVPVNVGTSGTTAGGTATGSGGAATPQATTEPDDDLNSGTGGPHDDGTSSSGGGVVPPLEIVPYCVDSLAIPDDGTTLEVPLEVDESRPAITLTSAVRVVHPRVQDLVIEVVGPDGTVVTLLDEPSCDRANIEAVFDDAAASLGNDACAVRPPAISGPVMPLDPLANITMTQGSWMLRVEDVNPGDVGSLEQWCLALGVEER